MAEILNGKELAAAIREEIREKVRLISQKHEPIPGLAVILVGSNPASVSYIAGKKKACQEVGFYSKEISLKEDTPQEALCQNIRILNKDPKIHGILVQLPLPKHIDTELVIRQIAPEKDVDGFHPINMGSLLLGEHSFVPCTPLGILEILKRKNIPISGKKALVIGRSNIVGKPMGVLLLRENATVTFAHSKTLNLEEEIAKAEILVSAIGKPQFIKGEWIKEGAVVIDVGINYVPDPKNPNSNRMVGDVDFETAKNRASFITPVPGGVGPMTNAMLLANTLKARNLQIKGNF